jgi:hypothetical protein
MQIRGKIQLYQDEIDKAQAQRNNTHKAKSFMGLFEPAKSEKKVITIRYCQVAAKNCRRSQRKASTEFRTIRSTDS